MKTHSESQSGNWVKFPADGGCQEMCHERLQTPLANLRQKSFPKIEINTTTTLHQVDKCDRAVRLLETRDREVTTVEP